MKSVILMFCLIVSTLCGPIPIKPGSEPGAEHMKYLSDPNAENMMYPSDQNAHPLMSKPMDGPMIDVHNPEAGSMMYGPYTDAGSAPNGTHTAAKNGSDTDAEGERYLKTTQEPGATKYPMHKFPEYVVEIFKVLDVNRDGGITDDEMVTVGEKIHQGIELIIMSPDVDQRGFINSTEFQQVMIMIEETGRAIIHNVSSTLEYPIELDSQLTADIDQLFDLIDTDKDGRMNSSELKSIVYNALHHISFFIKTADANFDGVIELPELADLIYLIESGEFMESSTSNPSTSFDKKESTEEYHHGSTSLSYQESTEEYYHASTSLPYQESTDEYPSWCWWCKETTEYPFWKWRNQETTEYPFWKWWNQETTEYPFWPHEPTDFIRLSHYFYQVFDTLDRNYDGRISYNEVEKMFGDMFKMTKQFLVAAVMNIDMSGDGIISHSEFFDYMRNIMDEADKTPEPLIYYK